MKRTIAQWLETDHGLGAVSDTPRLDLELLLCRVLGKERSYLFTWPDAALDAAQQAALEGLLQRRLAGEPIAYITGQQGFWSLDLEVNSSTLIPRPETELLVEVALSLLADRAGSPCRVADLGSGSGAIALALACERPAWSLVGVDRVAEAVALANNNAERLRLPNACFVQGNWCSGLALPAFDLVVSNPPYIDAADPHLGQGDVRFEPRSALVAGQQGLADIRTISEQARDYLSPGGWLLFEHGFEQGAAVRELMQSLGYAEVATRQDLAGLDRVTLGRWMERGEAGK
ncbi:peptide chain release factor N(5)-glutamine methyltransferase [Aestuariirhabdus litorea]|uniref:Release factor glutamine methyltransferase n=1 Tax=Aestuariirhabdus litorea TaxID=2528527 RepID=A0A3P3VLQ4_9GAMM|nr:peptide chain release factor N(5)-glutamine methyltransferase [Aestuariirhabdus litorea]RRJ83692.1 peptide chain release factor N(5)-glutamine methyltransferase [Aestuariirhabdus litorea]RWW96914.1 peptide chain release factor N(5)-glutamine methyltransferase [Endozoicomonadaceae bacterium GTF-13]